MEVGTERHGGTNNSSEVENGPENCNEFSLVPFSRVRHHKGSLGCPKQSSAKSKDSTSGNDKGFGMGVDVQDPGQLLATLDTLQGHAQKTSNVKAVALKQVSARAIFKTANPTPRSQAEG